MQLQKARLVLLFEVNRTFQARSPLLQSKKCNSKNVQTIDLQALAVDGMVLDIKCSILSLPRDLFMNQDTESELDSDQPHFADSRIISPA